MSLFSSILIQSTYYKILKCFHRNCSSEKIFTSCRIFWSSRNFYENKFGHFLRFFKSLKKNIIKFKKFKKSILKFFQIQKVSWSKNVLQGIGFLFLTSEWWYQRYSWNFQNVSEKLQFLHFYGLEILCLMSLDGNESKIMDLDLNHV